jgi:peptidylamidoglycolate lyase
MIKYFLFSFFISTSFLLKSQNNFNPVLIKSWPESKSTIYIGNPTGLGVDSKNNLVIFHRSSRLWTNPLPKDKIKEKVISYFDAESGKVINSWGENMFVMPHGLEIDNDDNIWVTDVAMHQVFKFNSKGELLLTLGKIFKPGDDQNHFNMPTDITVLSDGSFYVSDGYGNSRIIKFSNKGEFLFQIDGFGNGQNEFNIPHGIDNDNQNNIYVADRENNRIKKFDNNGNLLKIWQNKISQQLYSVKVDNKNHLVYAIDYYIKDGQEIMGSNIFILDKELKLLNKFGRSGNYQGPITRYHDIEIDEYGNIYAADILNNIIQVFKL